jgi:hypothetical protein
MLLVPNAARLGRKATALIFGVVAAAITMKAEGASQSFFEKIAVTANPANFTVTELRLNGSVLERAIKVQSTVFEGITYRSIVFPGDDNDALLINRLPIRWTLLVRDGKPVGFITAESIGASYSPPISIPNLFSSPKESVITLTADSTSPFIPQIEKFEVRALGTARKVDRTGFQVEAVGMEVLRFDQAQYTIWFGYGLGLIQYDHFIPQPFVSPNGQVVQRLGFMLTALPPPQIEGTVVEYRNTAGFAQSPGGHFFYTADPSEQAFVDAGGAGAFVRTGKSFNAGGYVRLCRFYGSQRPGPNSHFFTTDDGECKQLQSMQKTPTPTDAPQWNFEGYSFGMNAIRKNADGTRDCPLGSIAVYRAYNRAFDDTGKKNAWDSNHRLTTNKADIAEMVAQGWKDEGAVMCAPK